MFLKKIYLTYVHALKKVSLPTLFWIGISLIYVGAFLTIRDVDWISDEGSWHVPQIERFLQGNFTVDPTLAMLPTYHILMAGILRLLNANTLAEMRLINCLISSISILIFYILMKRLWPKEKYLRTVQFLFLPILFHQHFIVFTDAWALLFVLLAIERTLADRPLASASASFVAIALRQTNLFWAGFVWLLFLFQNSDQPWREPKVIYQWIRRTWPFLIVFASFVIFVWFNGGVVCDHNIHHHISFNLSNVWFYLFIFSILFWPNCLGTLHFILPQWERRSFAWACGIFTLLIIFFTSYHLTHPWNQPSSQAFFLLRNQLLRATSFSIWTRLFTFILVFAGLMGFLKTPLAEKRFWLLLPITFASIIVLPFIEQRYYIVPVVLFLAFRKSVSLRWELIQTGLYVLTSIWLFRGIAAHRFFL